MGRITEYLWFLNNKTRDNQFFWIEVTEEDKKIKAEIKRKTKKTVKMSVDYNKE